MTTGYFFEDLQVGQTASLGKTITEADILLYAAVTTDTNRSTSTPRRRSSRSSASASPTACCRPA